MTNDLQIVPLNSLRDLDGIALSKGGTNRDVVYGFAATFAFEGGSTVSRRMDSLAMMAAFQARFADRLNHYHPKSARSLRRFTGDAALEHYREQAEMTPDTETGGATLIHLKTPADSASASQTQCRATWASKWDRWSTVVATQPVGTVLDMGYGAYVGDVLAWCNLLRPAHGTAGLAMIPDFGGAVRSSALLAYPGLVRYPGFDWPDASLWAVMAREDHDRHIRTINWLTVLDDAFVETLGGQAALAGKLEPAVTLHTWNGGILLQAGPAPELGDTNAGDIPRLYGSVSDATRRLHFTDFSPRHGFLEAPSPVLSGEASRLWVDRFNSPEP